MYALALTSRIIYLRYGPAVAILSTDFVEFMSLLCILFIEHRPYENEHDGISSIHVTPGWVWIGHLLCLMSDVR